MQIHKHDAIIIGAGGAGLMAALYASKGGADVAVVSKLYPTRSHTGTAQGGIGAALGNLDDDKPIYHTYDTVKGGDYLTDQAAAKILAENAIEAVIELEHMGLPFDRTSEKRISQRRFGGHTRNFGEALVRRACHAADRTGHMILQTLYQQCIKNEVNFFDEFQVVDMIVVDGAVAGVVAIELGTGEFHIFHGKASFFATGGWGRCWSVTSNAHSLTGDGAAIALRRGVPLQDMEFFQFHPTGIYRMGILITEGVRGEGGVLLNSQGERFMERYAPSAKDLASRDVVSRAIYLETRAGRSIKNRGYVHLDVRPQRSIAISPKKGATGQTSSTMLPSSASCLISSISAGPTSVSIRSKSRCRCSRRRTMPWAASLRISMPRSSLTLPVLSCRARSLRARRLVSAFMAPIDWVRTRWWTWSSLGGAVACKWRNTSSARTGQRCQGMRARRSMPSSTGFAAARANPAPASCATKCKKR